ncbi:hypothetical protein Tco_0498812 [Tanacetum coccineum]
MTSITAQQTKLNLELVPKENRLDIGKCNGRIPRGLKPKEETFQVVLDALEHIPAIPEFYQFMLMSLKYTCTNFGTAFTSMTTSTNSRLTRRKDSNSLWKSSEISFKFAQKYRMASASENFCSIITGKSLSGKTSGLDKLRVVPPKIDRKFKKASPSKKDSIPVQVDEEPVQKGKRVKRSAKKSSTTLAAGIVFRETLVKTKSKGKEKVDVSRGKGIDLLSEVALAEKAQLKEVRKKSLRDFHKTHPSGSGTVAEKPPSVEKITPTVTSEGTGDKSRVPDVTEDDSTESESESWGNVKEMLINCHGHNLSKGNIIKIFYHDLNEMNQEVLNAATGGIFLYKTPNQAYQLLKDKVLLKLDWAKNQKTKSSLKKTIAFADEGSSNYDTDKIMARMDAMTMKMDAQYKEF